MMGPNLDLGGGRDGASGGCGLPAPLERYVAGELDADRAGAVAAHLQECQGCAGAATALRLRQRRDHLAAPPGEAPRSGEATPAPSSGREQPHEEQSAPSVTRVITAAHLRRFVRPGDGGASRLRYSVAGIGDRRTSDRHASNTSRPPAGGAVASAAKEDRRHMFLRPGAMSLAIVVALLGVLLATGGGGSGRSNAATAAGGGSGSAGAAPPFVAIAGGLEKGMVLAGASTVRATAAHVTGLTGIPRLRIRFGRQDRAWMLHVVTGHQALITGRLSIGHHGLVGAPVSAVAYIAGRPPRLLGSGHTGRGGRFQARIPVLAREGVVFVVGRLQSNLVVLGPRASSRSPTRHRA